MVVANNYTDVMCNISLQVVIALCKFPLEKERPPLFYVLKNIKIAIFKVHWRVAEAVR